MRHAVGLFGLVCSAIVISIAARYGFKTSDNDFDGYIWAFTFGAVTFGGLGGHMVGARLWRYEKQAFALVIFATSLLALLISLSNSLGAMAGRMNTAQAQRIQTADTVRDARRSLEAAERERGATSFKPTDQAAVDAAKVKAEAATKARATECQGFQENACRKKQDAEARALSELAALSQEKTATDHARDLDAEIKGLRAKIEAAGPVLEANSQGSALARLFALPEGDAAKLSTWQSLLMAIGIEILIVLSLISYEVMTQHEREQSPEPALAVRVSAPERAAEAAPVIEALSIEEAPIAFPAPTKPRLIASRPHPVGSVAVVMAEIMEPGRGQVEIADVFAAYAEACKVKGKRPIAANDFPEALGGLCERLGIKIDATDKGVFLLRVRLRKAEGGMAAQ
jgi:hypothetical protein